MFKCFKVLNNKVKFIDNIKNIINLKIMSSNQSATAQQVDALSKEERKQKYIEMYKGKTYQEIKEVYNYY
jgi:hypothetical protein